MSSRKNRPTSRPTNRRSTPPRGGRVVPSLRWPAPLFIGNHEQGSAFHERAGPRRDDKVVENGRIRQDKVRPEGC